MYMQYCALHRKHSKSSKRRCGSVYHANSFEADGTSEIPWCHNSAVLRNLMHAASNSTGSAGLSTAEGMSWLILMKTLFIYLFIYIKEAPCSNFILGESLLILHYNLKSVQFQMQMHLMLPQKNFQ